MKKIIINFIKIYRYILSPLTGTKCRYLPTCSEYSIDALKTHGTIYGLGLSVKRILSCHPIKFLGGGSGLDFVPKKNQLKKEKLNG
jgi:uncharacterized protein|tara:strand:- start:1492 stop:1749 length:258 start_codon:yes stop_codon:yes gene_type:complete